MYIVGQEVIVKHGLQEGWEEDTTFINSSMVQMAGCKIKITQICYAEDRYDFYSSGYKWKNEWVTPLSLFEED